MSRYSKAHYEQLARVICETLCRPEDTITRSKQAHRLAEIFAQDNPRFDSAKWFEACGVVR